MPDAWAVKQVFPVAADPPARFRGAFAQRAIVVDLTCDSDGQASTRFIDLHDVTSVSLRGASTWIPGVPYFDWRVFLVGAYQEILGDLHNLFGDTDAVHVRLDEDGGYSVEHFVEGDAVEEVLAYVQYDKRALSERVRRTIERALREGRIGLEDSALLRRRFDQGLAEYTYLSDQS